MHTCNLRHESELVPRLRLGCNHEFLDGVSGRVAYDTFITRCAAVLLVRESIQGFPFAHGDRHSSYAEAEYAVNFVQERFGTEPSHQAAADSGYIYTRRKLGGLAPNHGGWPTSAQKIDFF